MAGGKGKSIGGKGAPGKDAAGKAQKSHSAKAGLQVSTGFPSLLDARSRPRDARSASVLYATR